MTASPHPESDRVQFIVAVLDWLDARENASSTVDETFELLTSKRRRLLLGVMREYGEAVTLPDAAEAVASREFGRDVSNLSGERVATVYLSLYHDHLPRLVEAGLLEYDQEHDMVSPAAIGSR